MKVKILTLMLFLVSFKSYAQLVQSGTPFLGAPRYDEDALPTSPGGNFGGDDDSSSSSSSTIRVYFSDIKHISTHIGSSNGSYTKHRFSFAGTLHSTSSTALLSKGKVSLSLNDLETSEAAKSCINLITSLYKKNITVFYLSLPSSSTRVQNDSSSGTVSYSVDLDSTAADLSCSVDYP